MFWGLATPSYWACLHHGFECARALGLVWNFSPSQSTWESFFFALHSCSKSPIKLFLTPQVESGAPPVYISPAPCTLAQLAAASLTGHSRVLPWPCFWKRRSPGEEWLGVQGRPPPQPRHFPEDVVLDPCPKPYSVKT